MASLPMDDKDLDDAALWAVIDSAAAAYSTTSTSSSTIKQSPTFKSPPKPRTFTSPFSSPNSTVKSSSSTTTPNISTVSPTNNVHDHCHFNRPHKFSRSSSSNITTETCTPDLMIVKKDPVNHFSPPSPQMEYLVSENKENFASHCLAGRFPTVSLFKEYQDAAMSILEKSDYTVISGNPFIKKSGWRKIAFYFNVSFEIRDKTIEFDDNRNVQRAEFVARAYMQGGRFSDGWGSCERREKKFMKPNNDIPSTAETRAKNRACQDLLGIGQYRPGVSHNHTPR